MADRRAGPRVLHQEVQEAERERLSPPGRQPGPPARRHDHRPGRRGRRVLPRQDLPGGQHPAPGRHQEARADRRRARRQGGRVQGHDRGERPPPLPADRRGPAQRRPVAQRLRPGRRQPRRQARHRPRRRAPAAARLPAHLPGRRQGRLQGMGGGALPAAALRLRRHLGGRLQPRQEARPRDRRPPARPDRPRGRRQGQLRARGTGPRLRGRRPPARPGQPLLFARGPDARLGRRRPRRDPRARRGPDGLLQRAEGDDQPDAAVLRRRALPPGPPTAAGSR